MRVGGWEIEAVSVGGLETCIQVPALDLCFDIGRCPPRAVFRRRVLVTHTHMDHAGGIAMHAATRDLMKLEPPTWYVPRENHVDLLALLDVWRRLDRADLPVNLVPMAPGDAQALGGGWTATAFRSPHRVPTLGYAISREKKRLRADLRGLAPEAIRARRAAGEDVDERVACVEIAFCGDTLPEVIEREEAVRTARLLILECTFLDERVPVAAARGSGHVHLDELLALAPSLRNEAILLTHFSARYSAADVLRILDRRVPADLRARITPLLPPAG